MRMASEFIFDGNLARAARALVSVNANYVAKEAGITRKALRDFEKGLRSPDEAELDAIQRALLDLGAVFLPDGPAGGAGVRLKFNRAKSKQIDRWEGEGGPAAEDDV